MPLIEKNFEVAFCSPRGLEESRARLCELFPTREIPLLDPRSLSRTIVYVGHVGESRVKLLIVNPALRPINPTFEGALQAAGTGTRLTGRLYFELPARVTIVLLNLLAFVGFLGTTWGAPLFVKGMALAIYLSVLAIPMRLRMRQQRLDLMRRMREAGFELVDSH